MAARERIRETMAFSLQPGEQIRYVFGCQTGPSPYWAFLTWIVLLFGTKCRTVAVTDRAIIIGRSSLMRPYTFKEGLNRLPRQTRIGPVTGLWAKTNLGGEQVWIHRRFHKDVQAADAEMGFTY